MAYKSILDEISEELEKEGHKGYRTSFTEDRAIFNLPEEMKQVTKGQQSKSISPVGGRRTSDVNPPPNTKQFADQNKQLSLPGSSTIQSAAYWPTKEYLVVGFKSGGSYSYDGVTIDTVLNWEKASSAGSWFYYNIRKSFPYKKLG